MTIDDNDEGGGGGDDEDLVLPARSELDKMTLMAFKMPSYGEYFLRELQRSDNVGLDGLILTEAVSVDVIEFTSASSGGGGWYNVSSPSLHPFFRKGYPFF